MSDTKPICKNCAYFNWKVSGAKNWGCCMNPKVVMRISLTLADFGNMNGVETIAQYRAILAEIDKYARIYLEEDTFGCIHFEPAS